MGPNLDLMGTSVRLLCYEGLAATAEGGIDQGLESLSDKKGKSISSQVKKHFESVDPNQEELVIEIGSTAGSVLRMTVVRLSLDPNDFTAFFVFQSDENATYTG